jgi:predicted PurR-regulated permease PerM
LSKRGDFDFSPMSKNFHNYFSGLNPVWILVALLVNAKLRGILGLLIAVPLAASIKSMAHDLWNSPSSASTLTSPPEDV